MLGFVSSWHISYNCDDTCLHGTCHKGVCICDKGWQGVYCQTWQGRIKLEEPSGYITSGIPHYSTELPCTWLIDSGKANSTIRLKFIDFETECSWNYLYIFDGDSIFSPLIATLSGSLVSSKQSLKNFPEIIATSGQAYLYFNSDYAYNMTGFNVSYSVNSCPNNCSGNGICINGYCTCDGGWEEPACDVVICPNNCLPHGRCDKILRKCICNPGYSGKACNQSHSDGYWQTIDVTGEIQGRALHQSIFLNDSLWIVGGESFGKNAEKTEFMARYDFLLKKMTIVDIDDERIKPRFGHSLAIYEGKIYMFGGMLKNGAVANDLWRFSDNFWTKLVDDFSRRKRCTDDFCSPLSSFGHTANVVNDKMLIIFGYNPVYGHLNTVQEYDFKKRSWSLVKINGALVSGGFGHTSVYYPEKNLIYVHGGYQNVGSQAIIVDLMYSFNPKKKTWKRLTPSHSPRYLHSSVIINGLIYVYGGKAHNGTGELASDKCTLPKFLAYDIECDTWLNLKEPYIANKARYGHSAIAYRDSMYIFGGFNGFMLNSLNKYSPGNCSHVTSRTDCLKHKQLSLVSSSESNSSGFMVKSRCESRNANFTDLCQKQTNCASCLSNVYGCMWCGDSCNFEKCKKSDSKGFMDLARCPEDSEHSATSCDKFNNCHSCQAQPNCEWNISRCSSIIRDYGNGTSFEKANKENKSKCPVACHARKGCQNCTQASCIWCNSVKRCIDSGAYPVFFPIGQCMEWTHRPFKCPALSCHSIQTCGHCLRNPRCGWCDDGSGTGLGSCIDGSVSGPFDSSKTCNASNWYFTTCPDCQCNGHSSCPRKSKVCIKPCLHLTDGGHCHFCAHGYYGNPINGGNCTSCFCNNHADLCDRDTGKCYCTTKGMVGHQCDRCDEQNHYYGDPTEEGGSCYYNLSTDYQYTFNMSKFDDRLLKRINFMNTPIKPDIDVDFTIYCSETALVNISIGNPSLIREENLECDTIKLRFDRDKIPFGVGNTTFYVHVYRFEIPLVIQVGFSQHRTLDVLQFFITFSGCFLTLLFIAGGIWKIKQKYDMHRRRQQLYLELEHMASRPFASIVLDVDNDYRSTKEAETLLASKIHPTPIALEPCNTGKAAILSLILRLPIGNSVTVPPGQTGLAIGSALVSLGTLDPKLTKDDETVSTNKSINSSKRAEDDFSDFLNSNTFG